MYYKSTRLTCLILALGLANMACADLIVYEGFDYPEGSIQGNAGGMGWDAGVAWDGGTEIIAGNLEYPGLGSAGNSASTMGGVGESFRDMPASFSAENRVIWMSFIAVDNGATGWSGVALFNGGNERAFFGKTSGAPNWGTTVGGVSEIPISEKVFYVVRMDNENGNLAIWLNPDLKSEPSVDSAVIYNDNATITFNRIRVAGDSPVIYDELRLGDTYVDVTPSGKSEKATNPLPSDEADDVLRQTVLTWTLGEFAHSHNVYFGENYEDVNSATAPSATNLDVNSFDPGQLEFGQTYFWRVDEVNDAPDYTVFKGSVWHFTVEPYSIMIPVDVNNVTASSFAKKNMPALTVDGSGLTGTAHSTLGETMWLSAAADMSPWLMYEFDQVEKLDKMLIWNSNNASEGFIGWGVKDVNIETSMDGVAWTALGEVHQINQAPGEPTYDTPQVVDLGLTRAKFVRLNIQSNWGGLLPQYGVSEVQFYGLPVRARQPDPASGSIDIRPDSVVTWRAGREAGEHVIYASTDANALADGTAASVTSSTNSINLSALDLDLGETYYWRVDEVNEAEVPTTWAGPVWSMSTVSAVTVEDFESYNNFSPNRPFQFWLDGFGYSADEFFVEYAGNGTGSGIGHDIWSPSSPYFDGDIMETRNTIAGSGQALPFYYSNIDGTSTTEHTFAEPQDWTVGGVKTLSIAFNGQNGNTGTMFVVINNAKITYTRDNGNISRGVWQAWNIDLATVNTTLSNVTRIQLGVEGAGATGMILFDDITLHAEAGELITPADPGNDGLIAKYDFENNANDMSGNGRNGTLDGGAGFSVGVAGSALDLDGIDSAVDLGPAGELDFAGSFSVCAWINITDFTSEWGHAIMGTRGENDLGWQLRRHSTTPNLTFTVRGTDAVDDPQGTINVLALAGEWVQVTAVYDMEAGLRSVYVNGGLDVQVTDGGVPATSAHNAYIGARANSDNTGPEAFFYGLIDNVRVYNRALSQEEALSLAGITNPIDKPF